MLQSEVFVISGHMTGSYRCVPLQCNKTMSRSSVASEALLETLGRTSTAAIL